MNTTQKVVLNILILLNVTVYAVFGLYALVLNPAQGRTSAPTIPSVAQPVEVLVAPTPIQLSSLPPVNPADSPEPTLAPSPVLSPIPTSTALATPLPWQEGGSWWQSSTSLTTTAVALAPTASPSPTNTPLPWQQGGAWWLPASSPTPAFVPTRAAALAPSSAVALLAPSPAAKSAAQQITLPTPSGDSSSNAMVPGDYWNVLGSGATAWYKIGKGGDHMDVFVDATPMQGVTMQVFVPSNLDRPIGQGSLEKGRLVWSGGQVNSVGDWLARITNGNPAAVQYRLTSAAREITPCNTYSYWEWIGPNLVYWTACR